MMNKRLLVEELLENLSKDYADKKYVPILEADVVGYLYYLWISKVGSVGKVHLDTRICGFEDSRFDFVVGDVNFHAGKPCIKPELVIEVKSFPIRFTNQQHRVHYLHVIKDDIPKLGKLKEPSDNRYILLFDEDNYLKGFDRKSKSPRIDKILSTRNIIDSRIKVIWVNEEREILRWKIL
jgi:hypothetical protein